MGWPLEGERNESEKKKLRGIKCQKKKMRENGKKKKVGKEKEKKEQICEQNESQRNGQIERLRYR